ncbi:hypothetical protein BOTBODRAFT_26917 [Botryobasidium botryosum FD-172 SS1]|uniref:PAS domain-containing protein n=1 Tax=Botryobasidium botryosum (strain FD-172 SS1) TaxID=930990 RepID=A0A067NAX3_BOTB1|nr:hypothetical protein BOTBODRAFT_26917 [Botryobasidium botryosum FD-172 SS1]
MEDNEGLTFITIQDLTDQARILFVSDSVQDILGWTPKELVGRSYFTFLYHEEVAAARVEAYETIQKDKAAAVTYLQLRHKRGGFVLCQTSRSVVHTAIIGTVSKAVAGHRAFMKAATAQEVSVLTPSAADRFQFRKWGTGSSPAAVWQPQVPFDRLPTPSIRTGLILNRFSLTCPILYCTNACFIDPGFAQERSIYDFVAESDEDEVRHLIEIAKGFGMEGGVRSDGGFAYGKFLLYPPGRNSSVVAGSPKSQVSPRARGGRRSRDDSPTQASSSSSPPTYRPRRSGEILVEAILSAHSDGLILILRRAP